MRPPESMQHPKVTLEWALRRLEAAIGNLADGPAERRVRRQFHQVLLAVERHALHLEVQKPKKEAEAKRRVLVV
jgi:hypothetical protein